MLAIVEDNLMAIGEFKRFNQFKLDKGKEIHDLSSDTFKFAIIKSAANGGIDPTAATADPRWGAGGTTDLSASEVTAGGNYTAGGITCTVTWTESSGTVKFTSSDGAPQLQWLLHASNPTNARWIICYNDTAAGKQAVGYIDLGSDRDMTVGDLEYTVDGTNGFFIET